MNDTRRARSQGSIENETPALPQNGDNAAESAERENAEKRSANPRPVGCSSDDMCHVRRVSSRLLRLAGKALHGADLRESFLRSAGCFGNTVLHSCARAL